MSDKEKQTTGSIGFFGLLTIVFITLKLTGFITWHWFWVLSPILIPVGLVILSATIVIIIAVVAEKGGRIGKNTRR